MRLTLRKIRSLGPGEYRDHLVPKLLLRITDSWITDSSKAWGIRYASGLHRRVGGRAVAPA